MSGGPPAGRRRPRRTLCITPGGCISDYSVPWLYTFRFSIACLFGLFAALLLDHYLPY